MNGYICAQLRSFRQVVEALNSEGVVSVDSPVAQQLCALRRNNAHHTRVARN